MCSFSILFQFSSISLSTACKTSSCVGVDGPPASAGTTGLLLLPPPKRPQKFLQVLLGVGGWSAAPCAGLGSTGGFCISSLYFLYPSSSRAEIFSYSDTSLSNSLKSSSISLSPLNRSCNSFIQSNLRFCSSDGNAPMSLMNLNDSYAFSHLSLLTPTACMSRSRYES